MTNKEFLDLIELKFTGIRAELRAAHDIEMLELQHIKSRQEKANGKLERHDLQINGLDKVQGELIKTVAPIRWVKAHKMKVSVYGFISLILIAKIASLIPIEKLGLMDIARKLFLSFIP